MKTKVFVDTNVLLYLLSADEKKADLAEAVIRGNSPTALNISVQVLNEFTHVARRKLAMSWQEIDTVLGIIRHLCKVEPLTPATYDKGRHLAEQYRLSVYDALIVASALLAECEILYSEDMQNGQVIDNSLCICNPFKVPAS